MATDEQYLWRGTTVKKAIPSIYFAIFALGCGGSSGQPSQQSTPQTPPPVSVSILPSSPQGIDQGQSIGFTAILTNDSNNQGVTWNLSGNGCSGSACGTLANISATAATYNAPASVSSQLTVTVTATSVKE